MTTSLLKLQAKDSEDIQVISAILQDAIATLCDIRFDAEKHNFIMVVHRLRREVKNDLGLERICCAINMNGVEKAQLSGIDLNQQGRILDLLAVLPDSSSLTFIFAGDAKIRLFLSDWSIIVEDFGEAWPAQCNPCHDPKDIAI